MRILLVEDHPTMRFGLSSFLELEGGADIVGEADSAEEAVYLARKLAPDVVLLDLRLEGDRDGLEACRTIKNLPNPPYILVHSAHNSDDVLFSCRFSGADGYVYKGENPEKILEALKEVCNGKRMWLEGTESGKGTDSHPPTMTGKVFLTPKEKAVLFLVLEFRTNPQIAEQLHVSLPTVKTHMSHILQKFNCASRRELVERLSGR